MLVEIGIKGNAFLGSHPRRVTAACLALIFAIFLSSETAVSQTTLVPAAQEPFNRGLAAAQVQDWQLAIRYFTEAHKADPAAPQILFNLGLASSKLPDWELRALALFKAYLVLGPDGSNTSAVRNQVIALEVALESKITKLVDQMVAILTVYKPRARNEDQHLVRAAGGTLGAARYYLGDASGALEVLRFSNGADWKKSLDDLKWSALIVDAMASAGRFNETADLPLESFYRPGAYAPSTLEFLLERNDLAAAREFLERGLAEKSLKDLALTSLLWHRFACNSLGHADPILFDYALTTWARLHGAKDVKFRKVQFLVSVGRRDQAVEVAKSILSDEYPDDAAGLLAGSSHRRASDCRKDLWWSSGRVSYLTSFGLTGIGSPHDNFTDASLTEYLQKVRPLLTDTQAWAALVYFIPTVSNIANLASAYRRIRGPIRR